MPNPGEALEPLSASHSNLVISRLPVVNEAFVDIYIDPVNLLMRLIECLYAVGAKAKGCLLRC